MGNMSFGMQTWASKERGWIGSKSQASLIQNLMHILDTEEEWFPVKRGTCVAVTSFNRLCLKHLTYSMVDRHTSPEHMWLLQLSRHTYCTLARCLVMEENLTYIVSLVDRA